MAKQVKYSYFATTIEHLERECSLSDIQKIFSKYKNNPIIYHFIKTDIGMDIELLHTLEDSFIIPHNYDDTQKPYLAHFIADTIISGSRWKGQVKSLVDVDDIASYKMMCTKEPEKYDTFFLSYYPACNIVSRKIFTDEYLKDISNHNIHIVVFNINVEDVCDWDNVYAMIEYDDFIKYPDGTEIAPKGYTSKEQYDYRSKSDINWHNLIDLYGAYMKSLGCKMAEAWIDEDVYEMPIEIYKSREWPSWIYFFGTEEGEEKDWS